MYKLIEKKSINVEMVREIFGEEVYKDFMQLNDYNAFVLSEYLDLLKIKKDDETTFSSLKHDFLSELQFVKKFD